MWRVWGQNSFSKITSAFLDRIWESPYRFFSTSEYLADEHPCTKIHTWRGLLVFLSPGFYLGHLRGLKIVLPPGGQKSQLTSTPKQLFPVPFSAPLFNTRSWSFGEGRALWQLLRDSPVPVYFVFAFYHLQFSLFNLVQLFSWEQTHSISPSLPSLLSVFARFP